MDGAEQLKQELWEQFSKENQVFGRGEFYQSLEELDISGQRPTAYRMNEYEICKYVTKEMDVLDIGCNCGFLDIAVAPYVNSVLGVDYNETLISMGRKTAAFLNRQNVTLIANSFIDWVRNEEKEKYHAIFSFAVHYWLGLTPNAYADILNQLLKKGGYVFFESQNCNTVDKDFNTYCSAFEAKGRIVKKQGFIKDDNIIERKYLIYQKV